MIDPGLIEIRGEGDPLATWWMSSTPGVNYVRAEIPAKKLPGVAVHAHPTQEKCHRGEDGEWRLTRQEGDTAIWMVAGNATRGVLMVQQKELGHRVLVEVDDNYTVPPPINWGTWKDEIDRSGKDDPSYEAHGRLVRWADGVIVSTPALERVYRELNDNVFLCPNCVDPDDWEPSPAHQGGGILRVGFAGSDSHITDFSRIEPALRWASKQDGVEVVIVGIETAHTDFRALRIPWEDSVWNYRKKLENIDVMLCPLIEGEWSRCKSDLKALEAAMAGAMPVVSRAEPFRPWFNGPAWVVQNPVEPYEWKKTLRYLVNHRDEVRDMARHAREYVVRERSIDRNIWRWQEAVSADVAVAA